VGADTGVLNENPLAASNYRMEKKIKERVSSKVAEKSHVP
jgi:hypothetical protein